MDNNFLTKDGAGIDSHLSVYGNSDGKRSVASIEEEMNGNFLDSIGSMTFLNGMGDVTITWDKDKEDEVIKMIEQKMSEGYSFFIVEKQGIFKRLWNCLGGITPGQKEVSDINEIKDNKQVIIPDEALEKMRGDGLIKILKGSSRSDELNVTQTVRKKDSRTVARSHTIAVRPIRGG